VISKARFPPVSLGFRRRRPIEHQFAAGKSVDKAAIMSGRYAFAKGLKEVRFLFCQTGDHSSATRCVIPSSSLGNPTLTSTCAPRSFLTRAYPIMKKNNPAIPIMLREAQGTLPKIYARYGRCSCLSARVPRVGSLTRIQSSEGRRASH
jgi:hypothetical protein